MEEMGDKKAVVLENLEVASNKIDPYIKSIREAKPKVSENEEHFTIDLNRKRWIKGYKIFKEVFTWRAIIYGVPAVFITWLFRWNVVVGFAFLTATLLVISLLLICHLFGLKALFDMTDESKKEYFHFRAYTKYRREYGVFSNYLANGNEFTFKQALELMKKLDKEIEEKDAKISKLENDLHQMINKRLPSDSDRATLNSMNKAFTKQAFRGFIEFLEESSMASTYQLENYSREVKRFLAPNYSVANKKLEDAKNNFLQSLANFINYIDEHFDSTSYSNLVRFKGGMSEYQIMKDANYECEEQRFIETGRKLSASWEEFHVVLKEEYPDFVWKETFNISKDE